MNFMINFINEYGLEILMAIFTAVGGYIGIVIKNAYTKHINDNTKKSVVKTCVKAVEQLYANYGGEEKLAKASAAASEMLAIKGISITDLELRYLIEATVNEFKEKVQ